MESIGTLAGGIAHDLNNLLAPIMMGIGLLRQCGVPKEMESVVQNIELSAARGTELVKQVLSFARGVEGARIPLQLANVVREVEAIVTNTFPKNISFQHEIPVGLLPVIGDPIQLDQVVLNLCVNARDAMAAKGGGLKISAANVEVDAATASIYPGVSPGRFVLLTVADEGCGIPRDMLDRVFEPFFTTKELGMGTGLGLSTVLGIVKSHGGFVTVSSTLGVGTEFKVYLPAQGVVVPSEALGHDQASLPRGHGEWILVVDDEASILGITKQTLETFGYRVLVAEDGAQAISHFAAHSEEVALVLTDLMMPVMDGPTLIAALRRIKPDIKIIAASGLSPASPASVAVEGVDCFLVKPYSGGQMLGAISELLKARPV
jgi:CheY-like chemotaxis protein